MSQTPTDSISDLQEQRYAAAVQVIDSFRDALEHLAKRVNDAIELLACGHDAAAFEALRVQRDALLDAGFIRELPRAH